MFFRTNLKWLRKRKKRTQEEVAFAVDMKRSTYNGYENGVGEPGIDKLVALAKYFGISLDVLVKTDLRLLSDLEYQQLRQPETENKDSATMMRILREG